MHRVLARLAVAVFAFACGPVFATFHLWAFNELFSSADGKVQFVELRALTSGQQFLTGHSLDANGHTFQFPHDLPGDSGGHTMVIGTQSFANLGVVTPDYIVPDNFFALNSGTIVFGEGAAVWTYNNLPSDGTTSLNIDGSTGKNSPKNFAGQTGSVTVQATTTPPFNVQGLWWHDPDNSEGGWGVNLAHQGNTLFMSWFTYDTDGSNMWLYMDNATMSPTVPNTYSGALLRATGSSLTAYDPSKFHAVQVGNATFTFTDAGHGTFQYTVNGITQSKAIKRYVFGTLPTCDQSGAAATNFTDLWWRSPAASEVGWGINLIQQDNIIFLSWFTYDANGKGLWLYGSNITRTTGNTFTGPIGRNTGNAFNSTPWNTSSVTPVVVGSVTLAFTDTSNGTMTYTVDGVTQSKTITRFGFATPVTTCR